MLLLACSGAAAPTGDTAGPDGGATCFDRGLRQNGGSHEACVACCAEEQPEGTRVFQGVENRCACGTGACASNCHDWATCGGSSEAQPDYCKFCMEPALSSGGKCANDLASVCGAATPCAAYSKCAKGCP